MLVELDDGRLFVVGVVGAEARNDWVRSVHLLSCLSASLEDDSPNPSHCSPLTFFGMS